MPKHLLGAYEQSSREEGMLTKILDLHHKIEVTSRVRMKEQVIIFHEQLIIVWMLSE